MASQEGEGVPGEEFRRNTRSGREYGAFLGDLGRETGPTAENREFQLDLAGSGQNMLFLKFSPLMSSVLLIWISPTGGLGVPIGTLMAQGFLREWAKLWS